jgi:organic hydroperoxide reductase OsmC/OhrA
MLWFLSLAARRGFVVDRYRDDAIGIMSKDSAGKLAMTRVSDRRPTSEEFAALHHQAHEECFIARSVRTDVRCEPVALEV